MSEHAVSQENTRTVEEFYQSERDRDLERWVRFWRADGRHTFPTLGEGASVVGIDALREATRGKFETRAPYRIDARVEGMADTRRVFAELRLAPIDGEFGAPLWCLFTFDDDGKLLEIEEIYDRGGSD